MAYEKAVGMKYRWAEGDAADLLGQIFLVSGDKAKGRQWLKKAVVCRKEILDPKVKETEGKLKGKSDKG
jgi:hypothetical protein